MSAADAPAPRTPRVTIADLPTEIKSIIARMAKEQDDHCKRRRSEYYPRTLEASIDEMGRSRWDGCSHLALRLANREWSELSSAFQFETIRSTGCADDVYSFDIAASYLHVVRAAVFATQAEEADAKSLLRSLPFYTNLRRITFESNTAASLLGFESEDLTDEQQSHRGALKRLTRTVTEVVLADVGPAGAPWLPKTFPKLRLLDISLLDADDYDEDGGDFEITRGEISGLVGIEDLAIRSITSITEALLDRSVEWKCQPTLRRLHLAFNHHAFGITALTFIKQFKSTLETLKIEVEEAGIAAELISGEAAPERAPTAPLPRLAHLVLRGPCESVTTLFNIFSASPVVNLGLDIELPSSSPADAPEPFLPLLKVAFKTFKGTLKHCTLGVQPASPPKPLATLIVDKLNRLAARSQVGLSIPDCYDAFLHRSRRAKGGSSASRRGGTARRCDAAESALQFGLSLAARARITDDYVRAEALLVALEPLHAMRTRDRD